MNRVEIEPVDRVEITVLMDNLTDALLVDQEAVARVNWPKALNGALPTRRARVSPGSGVPGRAHRRARLLGAGRIAEAGASTRCCSTRACRRTGWSRTCAGSGSPRRDIEAIVLSHGHWDHVTGMEGLVRELGRTQPAGDDPPRVLGAAADPLPGLDPAELPATSRSALEDMGFAIVEERQPSFLLDGAVLITGEVDRTTPFETGFQGHEALRDGAWEPDPLILDDQALIVRLARPRARGPQRLRPRRDRQHRPLRAPAHGRGRRSPRSSAASTSAVRCSSRSSSPRSTRSPTCRPRSWCPRTAPGGGRFTASRRASPTRSS